MIYIGILLSLFAVITAISKIIAEKRDRDKTKKRLERFEKKYPPSK